MNASEFSEAYRLYLQTDHWQTLRKARFEIAHRRCEACGQRRDLQVHHIVYRNLIDCDPKTDLILLCQACHSDVHRMFDEMGKRCRSAKETLHFLGDFWKFHGLKIQTHEADEFWEKKQREFNEIHRVNNQLSSKVRKMFRRLSNGIITKEMLLLAKKEIEEILTAWRV